MKQMIQERVKHTETSGKASGDNLAFPSKKSTDKKQKNATTLPAI